MRVRKITFGTVVDLHRYFDVGCFACFFGGW